MLEEKTIEYSTIPCSAFKLNFRSRASLETVLITQLLKKVPAFCATQNNLIHKGSQLVTILSRMNPSYIPTRIILQYFTILQPTHTIMCVVDKWTY